jgi:hypothetical protein
MPFWKPYIRRNVLFKINYIKFAIKDHFQLWERSFRKTLKNNFQNVTKYEINRIFEYEIIRN